MKSFINLLLGVVVVGFVSCDSNDVMDAFSDKGAAYDKNYLEANAQAVEEELKELGKTDFAMLCKSMNKRLEEVELDGNARFVEGIVHLGYQMYEAQSLDTYFGELMSLTFDRDYYCKAILSQGFGIWEWQDATQSFVKTDEHESDVIFTFPATEDAEGELAILTISDLVVYDGLFPGKGEELNDGSIVEQALERLKFSIKVNEELLLTGNVMASFTDDGFFKDVAMTFNPRPFNLIAELGKTKELGYWVLSFNRDSELIMGQDLNLEFELNNTQMPVSRIVNSHLTKDVYIEVDAKTGMLYNELLKVEKLEEGSQINAQALANALNNYAAMSVRYVGSNRIIAEATAVPKLSDDELTWLVDLEFTFSDGSVQSGEVYFDDYISNFKVELESLVSEFENKFGV